MPALRTAPLPTELHLFGTNCEAYHVTKVLMHTADPKELSLPERVKKSTKTITALDRRAKTTRVPWELAVRYAHSNEFDKRL